MDNKILVNRYELIEEIGKGGMATVWKARCNRLNRFVAIKIFDYSSHDNEFIKRFHIEAQSAASLSHPNIVSIYDVGYDHKSDVHFIVMEYMDGNTLKEYISEKGFLNWRDAVNKMLCICSAIQHAHENHIIHRDIKPHNILLTKNGIPKVTDFGIARATLSLTISVSDSTLGSVHYLSPEQAKGRFTSEKSDIYSLGIMLYEMLTGKVPFTGDNPVAIALKHINTQPIDPIIINKNIPKGLNDIIKKTISKDQNSRYPSVKQMMIDLQTLLDHPSQRFESSKDIQDCPTMILSPLPIPSEDTGALMDDIKKASNNKKSKKKNDKLFTWAAISTSVLLIGIFSFFMFSTILPSLGIFSSTSSNDFIVGNYVERPFNEVEAELKQKGVEVKKIDKPNNKIAAGIIVSQNKSPGEKVKIGGYSSVEFEVSSGPTLVKVPSVKNIDYRQAELELTNKGLVVEFSESHSNSIKVGNVVYTDPKEGSEVKIGSTVTVFKSKGPQIELVTIPDLIGKTKAAATALLENANLKVGQLFYAKSSNIADYVTKQDPDAGIKIKAGSSIDLYFDKSSTTKVKVVKEVISLDVSNTYGNKINVLVEITPSNTGISDVLINEDKNKTDFPINFTVNVPENGSTKIRVYLDNQLYSDRIERWSSTTG